MLRTVGTSEAQCEVAQGVSSRAGTTPLTPLNPYSGSPPACTREAGRIFLAAAPPPYVPPCSVFSVAP